MYCVLNQIGIFALNSITVFSSDSSARRLLSIRIDNQPFKMGGGGGGGAGRGASGQNLCQIA